LLFELFHLSGGLLMFQAGLLLHHRSWF